MAKFHVISTPEVKTDDEVKQPVVIAAPATPTTSKEPVFEIHLQEWLAREKAFKSRTMRVKITKFTGKAMLVTGYANVKQSTHCMRCGKEITHPASMLVGYGIDCVHKVGLGLAWISAADTLTEAQIIEIKKAIYKETLVKQVWLPLHGLNKVDDINVRDNRDGAANYIANKLGGFADAPIFADASILPEAYQPTHIDIVTAAHNQQEGEFISITTDRRNARLFSQYSWSHPGQPYYRDHNNNAYHVPLSKDNLKYIIDLFVGVSNHDVIVQPAAHAILEAMEQEEQAQSIKTRTELPDIPMTKTEPWLHQRQAFWFAKDLPACMLAMEMGTGKSKVAVDLICNNNAQYTLIVAPKSVVRSVWAKQFQIHSPKEFYVAALTRGTAKKKLDDAQEAIFLSQLYKLPLVIIVSYNSVFREPLAKWILKFPWDYIVLDESHRIKSPKGVSSVFCGKLGKVGKQRLALTGTPMPHSPMDIWSQFRFLDPSIFGSSFTNFKNTYANVERRFAFEQITGYKNQSELNKKLFSISYRVKKEDALDLPEYQDVERIVTLEPKVQKIYNDMATALVAEIENGIVTASNAIVKLLRLQQITGGSLNNDDGDPVKVSSAKENMLDDVMEDLPTDEPLVVFTRFRYDLNVVKDIAAKQGRDYYELSGRINELQKWQDAPRGGVIGVQISSGGVGVDLTRAAYNIYYSLGFSLGDYDQSRSRSHRPGQERNVMYIHLICENTVDRKVYQALSSRKAVVDYVLEGITQEPIVVDEEYDDEDGE